MKCRYVYCPMTAKRIGRRMTIADRFRSWQRKRQMLREEPELFMVTGFYPPVFPGK